MRHRSHAALFGVAALVVAATGSAPLAGAKPSKDAVTPSAHDRVVAGWTNDRVAQALPRDVVRPTPPAAADATAATDAAAAAAAGKAAKPAPKPDPKSTVQEAAWTRGGVVARTTGKVLFQSAGLYWVCSGSVVQDGVAGRSFVLTAAHCVVDEVTGEVATDWMFVPDYDRMPARLTGDGSFCAATAWGCWTAIAAVVDARFAGAGDYTDDAAAHDAAVVVVGPGGKSGTDELDVVVGAQPVLTASVPMGSDTYAFGYPVDKKRGTDLTYCRGPLFTDPWASDLTYGVRCGMGGGASGGPWLTPFDEGTGTGTVVSVNTYGYRGVKAMYGPIFGDWTAALLADASTALGYVVHS